MFKRHKKPWKTNHAKQELPARYGAYLLFVFVALLCGACKPSEAERRQARERVRLVIFAASSLRNAFVEVKKPFERARPDVEVVFNFAGTQELRSQVEHGAEADVFASADTRHMDALVRLKLVSEPRVFAYNEPVLVVAKESAAIIHDLSELPRAKRIVLGGLAVPIGRYSQEILDRACVPYGRDFRSRVESKVVSRELNVRQVLAKVALGEADSAIVYRSDTLANHDRVAVVPIDQAVNVIAEYPIAALSRTQRSEMASAWIGYLLGDAGQRILRQAGFVPPSERTRAK